MKLVCQLDKDNFYVSTIEVVESPEEKGKYIIPAGCVSANPPTTIPKNHRARWVKNEWKIYPMPRLKPETRYDSLRASEYPLASEYFDAIVKGDQEQLKAYIDTCKAVKKKFPRTK